MVTISTGNSSFISYGVCLGFFGVAWLLPSGQQYEPFVCVYVALLVTPKIVILRANAFVTRGMGT